jgi:hypothetical protein
MPYEHHKGRKVAKTHRGGGAFPSNLPIFWLETGIPPLIFIVRRLGLILCNHLRHLRWGHLPSAGPRQKKGAEL